MNIVLLLITLIILIYSAILHEIAHGLVAERLGDPTAKLMGRLTLNPKNHIDPYMTILLPLITFLSSGGTFMFGGAKPVPIDPFNLRDGRKDIALVSLAGPGTNVLLAIISAIIFRILAYIPLGTLTPFLSWFFFTAVQLNLLLAIFNLIPIPPLDGSKIFALILPENEANAYLSMGMFGMLIIFSLLIFNFGGFSLGNFMFSLVTFSEKLLGL